MMKWLVISTLFVLADVAFSCINPPPVWRDRGQKLTITCPKDMYISVVFSASYASIPANICSDPNALTTVKNKCLNKHTCTINVQSQSPFPCPGLGDRKARLWVDYACCRGTPTNEDECVPTPVEVRPQVGDCISEKPITVSRCMGGCESGAEYPFGSDNLNTECECCVPTETERRTEILKCKNGKSYRYTFVDVVDCDCKPCEEVRPDNCHVDTEEIYPRINGCVGISKIKIGKCHGGCPSSSRFPGQDTVEDIDCTCCVPVSEEELSTVVRCRSIAVAESFISAPNEFALPPNYRRIKYQWIKECECRPCKRYPFIPGAVDDVLARAVAGEEQPASAAAGEEQPASAAAGEEQPASAGEREEPPATSATQP